MRTKIASLILAGALALAGCAKSSAPKTANSSAAPAPAVPAAPVAPLPDVGSIQQVQVSTQGIGATADAAVQEALRLAILEVNGESIDTSTVAVKFGLDVADGQSEESLRGSAFSQAVASSSKGTISHFKLVSLTEPAAAGQPYKATIEASIAKFSAPADSKKIKIVIAPLHVSTDRFMIGGNAVPAAQVADEIRQRLIDALTATGRFSVLDRDFGPEVQSELDLVASGQTPSDEMAKLSQTLSADVVWVGSINDFGYQRHAQHLQLSGRDLVSYSGGWSVSDRVLNVATRQILLSDTLQGQVPSTAPTTMDRGIDSAQWTAQMESSIVDRALSAILSKTFPIVVVSKKGTNVILSQGGEAMKVGARYAIVALGEELKDPQTGASLGRTDTPCCDVVLDRVSSQLAYGHLENVQIPLDSVEPAGLQVREELDTSGASTNATPAAPSAKASTGAPSAVPAPVTAAVPTLPAIPALPAAHESANDKKW